MQAGLILLDRDGVLNAMVVDPEHGTMDSPLHPSQVEIIESIPEILGRLTAAGFELVICSNQPAAAKGKTTLSNLEKTHAVVVEAVQSAGARILSSHICLHRQEDGCACRKPKTGLLDEAFERHPQFERSLSWMIGDGITDVQAGTAAGVKTCFLAPKKIELCTIAERLGVRPDFWCPTLKEFAEFLIGQAQG